MKITKITASFECKKQIRQYEPISVFMAVEAEVDIDLAMDKPKVDEAMQLAQDIIFKLAKSGVDTEIERLTGTGSTPSSREVGIL